jgi:hypothetical protein
MAIRIVPHSKLTLFALVAAAVLPASAALQREGEFESLFDGKTLNGWTLVGKKGDGYGVKDGVLYCAQGGGGNLFTEKEFSDFVLRFEFKLDAGANNGLGVRCPLVAAEPSYLGMELQILEDSHPKYTNLRPAQYHGSLYDVVPAKRGALKPPGEWNFQEVTAKGRRITVRVNGMVILDANINDVHDPEVLRKHPGLLRDKGHIGFLGHNDYCEFRNIQIKELPKARLNNSAPEGFTRLFSGRDLTGWKGSVADPPNRAKMAPEELIAAQAMADQEMLAHWRAVDGVLVFDGKGKNLCTARDYSDFELLVDWKIEALGDSGIYLRGSPQVQIWDREDRRGNPKRLGSGGLYNNKKNPSEPLGLADHVVGDWNTFRIVMVGDKVHVYLNDRLVVRDTTLENYWQPDLPIYPMGQIELQNHGNNLYFRNVYVREIATPEAIALKKSEDAAVKEAAVREAARKLAIQREANEKMDLARREAARVETAKRDAERRESMAREEAARKESAAKEEARREAVRREAAAREVAMREASAKKDAERREMAAREEAVRKETAAKEEAKREAARKEAAAKEVAAREDAARKEMERKEKAGREEASKKEAAARASAMNEAARRDAAAKEAAVKEAARKEAAAKEAARMELSEKAQAARKEAAAREAAVKEAAAKEAARKDAAAKETARMEKAAKEEGARKEAAARDAARMERAAKEEAARKDAAAKEAAKIEAARKEAEARDAARKEAARKEAAAKEAARMEVAAKAEIAKKESAAREAGMKEAARKEAAAKEAARMEKVAKEEAARKDAAAKEAAKIEAARKEAEARDAARKEAARKEAAAKEAARMEVGA